jgi:hypothetical protein
MRLLARILALIFAVSALLWQGSIQADAQQSNAPGFSSAYLVAAAKAQSECNKLWSDRAFDELRTRVPIGGQKPTFAMLTDKRKVLPKDKAVADLALKTVENCRHAYLPVYAMLPPQVFTLIQGLERRQDDLIARLLSGEITYGDFNVGFNEISAKAAEVLSAVPNQAKSAAKEAAARAIAAPKPQQPAAATPIASFHGNRLALVIGNGDYANLPKLTNPPNDARSIAQVFEKMGYKTQLLLDGSGQSIRNAVRKFASDSASADVAVVYYAGHGAQLDGRNYLLPIDTDIPRTAADIEFSGLKIDDLVNSIGANTKIVFLDACRDNPVLFRNIVSGRGVPSIGLAPASASNLNESKPGGWCIYCLRD